jgi:hypothetical protein
MGERNEVVDKANESEGVAAEGEDVGGAVQVGVAKVEEDGVFEVTRKQGRTSPAYDEQKKTEGEVCVGSEQEAEESRGGNGRKDPEAVEEKNGRACLVSVAVNIFDANTVHTGVQLSLPRPVEKP